MEPERPVLLCPPARASGERPDSVAVRTTHDALLDLSAQGFDARGRHEPRQALLLHPDMVEVQYHGIVLPAVATPGRAEDLDDEDGVAQLRCRPTPCGFPCRAE